MLCHLGLGGHANNVMSILEQLNINDSLGWIHLHTQMRVPVHMVDDRTPTLILSGGTHWERSSNKNNSDNTHLSIDNQHSLHRVYFVMCQSMRAYLPKQNRAHHGTIPNPTAQLNQDNTDKQVDDGRTIQKTTSSNIHHKERKDAVGRSDTTVSAHEASETQPSIRKLSIRTK